MATAWEDGGEQGLASQFVYFYQGINYIGSAYTDAFGHYYLGVPPGTYTISYAAPGCRWHYHSIGPYSSQGYGIYDSVIVSGGGYHCGYNFGLADSNITISGYVYIDANGNGVKDPG